MSSSNIGNCFVVGTESGDDVERAQRRKRSFILCEEVVVLPETGRMTAGHELGPLCGEETALGTTPFFLSLAALRRSSFLILSRTLFVFRAEAVCEVAAELGLDRIVGLLQGRRRPDVQPVFFVAPLVALLR